MTAVFSECGFTVHETGLKHGTLTVVVEDGETGEKNIAEVTTFRIDGEYSDNRRPNSVTFTKSLQDDLSRRDFTVNAMAYSNQTGIVDYFGGESDLKNKILRAAGDPYTRFREDGLRILRAYRFSAVLGFSIEETTLKAACDLQYLIHNISGERIAQELNKTAVGYFKKNKVVSLALLFGNALDWNCEKVRKVMRKLKYDNDAFYKVLTLVRFRGIKIKFDRRCVKLLLKRFGEEMFFLLASLLELNEDVMQSAQSIIENGECYSLNQLAVKGGDLVELGYKGKEIGTLLEILLHAVISGKCNNNREELISYGVNGYRD
jgi:tRNA nucleotidyltransferase (CCA-adding enzyme)